MSYMRALQFWKPSELRHIHFLSPGFTHIALKTRYSQKHFALPMMISVLEQNKALNILFKTKIIASDVEQHNQHTQRCVKSKNLWLWLKKWKFPFFINNVVILSLGGKRWLQKSMRTPALEIIRSVLSPFPTVAKRCPNFSLVFKRWLSQIILCPVLRVQNPNISPPTYSQSSH